jgi:hypothetical protein
MSVSYFLDSTSAIDVIMQIAHDQNITIHRELANDISGSGTGGVHSQFSRFAHTNRTIEATECVNTFTGRCKIAVNNNNANCIINHRLRIRN